MTETAVRRELWISFVGLLHSYLAAATLGAEAPVGLITETNAGAVQIAGPSHTVRAEFRTDSGLGYWIATKAPRDAATEAEVLEEGAFRLHLNAEFEWSGKPGRLAMDAIAEALTLLALS